LPLLTYSNKEAEGKVADLVSQNVKNLHMLSEDSQTNYKWDEKFRVEYYCERFLNFLESSQNSVKQTFTDRNIADDLSKYVEDTLTDDLIEKEEDLLRFEKPLSLALKSLAWFLKSNASSQAVILKHNESNNLIEKIFKLSKTKLKQRNLSILAEGVIESMTFESDLNDKKTHDYVKNLVNAEDSEKKKKAEKRKKAMLARMKKNKMINKKIKYDDIKEEKGIRCIICQEGYQESNQDLMGVYVFVKKIIMAADKVISKNEEAGYTSVTHFNSIHFKCHRNAYDADSNRKKALSEWDGAQIRNSHTKCNGLFPIKGGSVTEESYRQYVNEYLSNLSYNIFQVSMNKTKVMFYDLMNLVKRLAFEESFSKDSNGGSAEHNINFVPFMIHMTLSIMKDNGELLSNKQQDNADKFLEDSLNKIDELKKSPIDSEVEEQKVAEEIEEEVKIMSEIEEDIDEEDFDALAKTISQKLDAWMYWSLVASIMSTDDQWNEQKWKFFQVSKHLAKMNSKFLPAGDKIFILSEKTKEKQEKCSAKSSINKYANSAKKVILYFTILTIFREKFIKGEGKLTTQIDSKIDIAKETLSEMNNIKIHEDLIKTCQDIFLNVYSKILSQTGEQILQIAFTKSELDSDKFTTFE